MAGFAETGALEQGQRTVLPGISDITPLTTRMFMMSKGEVGASIKVDQGYVIPQLTDIEASRPATFDESKDRVLNDAKTDKALELATEKGNQIQDMFKAGKDLNAIAKAMGGTVKSSDLIARTGVITEFGPIADQEKAIFSLAAGKTGKPVTVGGKTLVYSLKEHQDINPDEMTKALPDLTKEMLNARREQYFNAYVQEIKKKMESTNRIAINESILATIGQSVL